jgi:putative heme-binding domain-containing protein
MRRVLGRLLVCGVLIAAGTLGWLARQAPAQDSEKRIPWTTSRVHGSPEPPPPYRLERVFPKLSFQKLTHMAAAPGTRRLFLTTELGQIYSFNPDEAVERADPFLNLAKDVPSCQPGKGVKGFDALYSLVFHPKYPQNRLVYVAYVVDGTAAPPKSQLTNRQRLSSFTVIGGDIPRADPASEKIIMEWATEKGGHNGCTLCFGPDGYLYLSVGDGGPATPPDRYNTGQDLSDFLSSILRIDVDHTDGDKLYKVPADNPFVKMAGARPEIWAFGLRNPWKMSFDRATGELWVGDVGWEMWEMIYRIKKGANYGWSLMEGPQAVHPAAKLGPTPIVPPNLVFSHADAASITGGYVYHGKRLPQLVGSYLSGDYMTCKVWSTRFDGDRVVSHKEIAQGRMRVIGFGEDNEGELFILGYAESAAGDGIYKLVPNEAKTAANFPRKLSETGLFSALAPLTPAPGVLPYAINAAPWIDHATAQRVVGLPDVSTVRFFDYPVHVPGTAFYNSRIFFPGEAVLAKTISMEMQRGNPKSSRNLETQILHFDGNDWFGYTYRWNDTQTDAELVPAGGAEVDLDIADADAPGGHRKQTWRFASRGQCLMCHNGWAGPPLGFTPEQLKRGGQLERLQKLGVVAQAAKNKGKASPEGKIRVANSLADPYDASQDLTQRARSYLHVNCAHCHQNGAGGTATIDLRAEINLNAAKALDVTPVQGSFQIADGKLLAAGDPYRSVLYYRIAKNGPGRMPHIGSEIVDARGIEAVHDWIQKLPAKGGTAAAHGDEKAAMAAVLGMKAAQAGKSETLGRLLSSTPGALMLAREIAAKKVPADLAGAVVAAAAEWPDSHIRDLFERFLPDDKRVKRLGPTIQPLSILGLKGDVEKGRTVFFKTAGINCATCHKIGKEGGAVGPDLSEIGKKYDRAKILESILDPSKDIDPAFVSYSVQLGDGRVVIGLVISRNDKEIVVRDAQAKEHRFASVDIDTVVPQRQSLMPEQLLRDLTAQQAVDLVDFLSSLKSKSN